MDLKAGVQTTIPKPFDLSRFISAAVTFLVKVKEVTILFNGIPLSKITKSRGNPIELELPTHLKACSPAKSLTVNSVKRIGGSDRQPWKSLTHLCSSTCGSSH